MNTDLGELLLPAVIAAVVSVVVMESYQTTPWLADKLMRWSVRLRYADNPERAKVRGEELIGLLEDLPTLFKLPTAGGFVLRALAYRLANHRSHPRRQPRAVQHSLGTRFRIALFEASLVVVCTGTVIWTELVLVDYMLYVYTDSILTITWSLMVGIAAASEVAARPFKVPHGLVGGIIYTFSVSAFATVYSMPSFFVGLTALLSGTTFGVASSVTYVLVRKFRHRKFKHIGVIVGTLINIAGVILLVFAILGISNSDVLWFSGVGFASGAVAGFAVAVARRAQDKIGRSSNSAVVRASVISTRSTSAPKPSIPMSEPKRPDPSTIK